MRHIHESIIGRKGSRAGMPPEIEAHDIVITRDGEVYMVLTDPDEIIQVRIDSNKINGGILCRTDRPKRSWVSLARYNKLLEFTSNKPGRIFDIDEVYRGVWAGYDRKFQNVLDACDVDNLWDLISDKRKYDLVWKRY